MPLFRRGKSRGPEGRATIRLFGDAAGVGVDAVTVAWEGDESVLVHLFSTYLDKGLANLSRMKQERAALWGKVDSVLDELAELMDGPGDELPPLPLETPIVEDYPGEPMAQITVEVYLNYERQRYWAATHFKPLRAQNETVAEIGLWSILQWTLLATDLDKRAFAPLLTNLLHQRVYYEEHGLPGLRAIGKAPFYAGMKGASDSLPTEERHQVMDANFDERMARREALEQLAERWVALWGENSDDFFDPGNGRWRPIRAAVAAHVSQLDLGSGDLVEKALGGQTDTTEQERLNGQVLMHLGLAGYLWRDAERETDTTELGASRVASEFMSKQGSLDDRPRKDILKEFALWATESFLPLGLGGDNDVEFPRNIALDTILEGTGLVGEPREIPAESADSVFRFGTLMREADYWLPPATPSEAAT